MADRIKTVTLAKLPEADYRAQDKKFLDSAAWRNFRKVILARDPICTECHEYPSTDAHHNVKRRVAPWLALDYQNTRGVCSDCHAKMKKSVN